MTFLIRTMDYLLDPRGRAPRSSRPARNRVDADPQLIAYHESGKGPKPTPSHTISLPLRTRLAVHVLSDIGSAQTEAYYEELDTIPAASVGKDSEFSAGNWYVMHPMTWWDVEVLSSRVLLDIKEWVENTCPNEFFTSKAKQVMNFRKARDETLSQVTEELGRREQKGQIRSEEGYTGSWDVLGAEEELEGGEKGKGEEKKHEGKGKTKSRHTPAALEAAAQAGLAAAQDANDKNEWETIDHFD